MQGLNEGSSYRIIKAFEIKRFIILFLLVSGLYVYKINKGFPTFDEALYIALPWRFLSGDVMFRDEWMGMQMSSFLLLPVMKLFFLIRPNMNYVILFFRLVYWCFQAGICVIMYLLLRTKTEWADVMAVLYYAFVPFGLMALSYNTIPLGLLMLFAADIASEKIDQVYGLIIAGICLAGMVICQPGCVLLAPLLIFFAFIGKGNSGILKVKNVTIILGISLGLGIAFLCYIAYNTDFHIIMAALSAAKGDTAHFTEHALLKRIFFIDALVWIRRPHVLQFLLSWLIIIAFYLKLRKRSIDDNSRRYKQILFVAGLVVSSLFLICESLILYREIGMNAVMIPFTPIGAFAWIQLSNNRKEEMKSFGVCIILSFAYMYCNHLMSNNTPNVISIGCAVSSVFSVPVFGAYLSENMDWPLLQRNALMVFFPFFFLFSEVFVFLGNVYCDDSILKLNYYIDNGPAKGIYTSRENYINYTYTLYDLDKMKEYGVMEDDLLYIDMDMLIMGGPIYHMYTGNRISPPIAYSGHEIFESDGMLQQFYNYYPDKKPDIIFIPDMVMNSTHSVTDEEIEAVCKEYGLKQYKCNSDAILLIKVN